MFTVRSFIHCAALRIAFPLTMAFASLVAAQEAPQWLQEMIAQEAANKEKYATRQGRIDRLNELAENARLLRAQGDPMHEVVLNNTLTTCVGWRYGVEERPDGICIGRHFDDIAAICDDLAVELIAAATTTTNLSYAWYWRGKVARDRRRYTEASEHFAKAAAAINADPDWASNPQLCELYVSVVLAHGLTLDVTKDHRAAPRVYATLLEPGLAAYAPDQVPYAYSKIAMHLMNGGDIASGRAWLRALWEQYPDYGLDDGQTWFNLRLLDARGTNTSPRCVADDCLERLRALWIEAAERGLPEQLDAAHAYAMALSHASFSDPREHRVLDHAFSAYLRSREQWAATSDKDRMQSAYEEAAYIAAHMIMNLTPHGPTPPTNDRRRASVIARQVLADANLPIDDLDLRETIDRAIALEPR